MLVRRCFASVKVRIFLHVPIAPLHLDSQIEARAVLDFLQGAEVRNFCFFTFLC